DRAEEDLVAAIDRRIDDDRALEALRQVAHAAIDLAEALLAVDVLGVLRAIALRGGVAHLVHDARALDAPELAELLGELLRAGRRDVVRVAHGWRLSAARCRRRRSRACGAPP